MAARIHVSGFAHDGRHVFLNEPTEKVRKLGAKWLRTTGWEWAPKEHREAVKNAMAVCLMTGEPQSLRTRVELTGEEFLVEFHRVPDGMVLLSIGSPRAAPVSLTRQERAVLKHLANGLSPTEIASKLRVKLRTVEVHRKNLLDKTGAKNDVQLGLFAASSDALD